MKRRKKKITRDAFDRVLQGIREKKFSAQQPAPAAPAIENKHEIHIHNHTSTSPQQDNPADADLKRLLDRSKWLP